MSPERSPGENTEAGYRVKANGLPRLSIWKKIQSERSKRAVMGAASGTVLGGANELFAGNTTLSVIVGIGTTALVYRWSRDTIV